MGKKKVGMKLATKKEHESLLKQLETAENLCGFFRSEASQTDGNDTHWVDSCTNTILTLRELLEGTWGIPAKVKLGKTAFNRILRWSCDEVIEPLDLVALTKNNLDEAIEEVSQALQEVEDEDEDEDLDARIEADSQVYNATMAFNEAVDEISHESFDPEDMVETLLGRSYRRCECATQCVA